MPKNTFRFLTHIIRKYPKPSAAFIMGTTIYASLVMASKETASLTDKKKGERWHFFPSHTPDSNLVKQEEPLIDLEKFHSTIHKKVSLKEFKARSPLYADSEKTYEGYDLIKVLAALNIDPAKTDLVIFEAKDGFKSSIPSALILKYHPVLAIRQKSASHGRDWETVYHSLNGETDGGPFYLMWPGDTHNEVVENHWAFGVTQITFGSFEKIFGPLSPQATKKKEIWDGYKLFVQNCSCCHTFFEQGSAHVGMPVENIPGKYPSWGSIAAYAARPPKSSAMPPQQLTKKELLDVEAYIRFKTEGGLDEDNIQKETHAPNSPF